MKEVTPRISYLREQVIIQRAIGDSSSVAEAEASFYRSAEGRMELRREGRLLELLFASAHVPVIRPI